ncbi:iron-containing alcohol dehydrogenase [Brevibacillus sp. NRS-1366]|uniref:iron-containing alcohol dehydrogenase n=1 Tax=Brevibacillus sp. NRS-1366 TaxID=3233899 RepID=UPI003D234226
MDFEFLLPTKIVMKKGIRFETGAQLKALSMEHVLVITDSGIKNAGLLTDIYASLAESGVTFEEFSDVKPNPRDADCDLIAAQTKGRKIDGILAIGGGSVIDTAKAVSILHTNGGSVNDYEGAFTVKVDPTPIVCIPTTAGTGSEVTFFSVITDMKRKYKMSILDYKIGPKLALLDVDLTASLPASIASSTGMDALTHSIEAYTARVANPISDALALHAIKLISENLLEAVHGTANEQAREQMLVGSLIAGAAFGNADIGSVHCISEAIGGLYDTPHGVANAIFLPYVFKQNIDADVKRHAEVGYALGVDRALSHEDAAKAAVEILFTFSEKVNIPKFRNVRGVNPEDFALLAQNSKKNISDFNNAKAMTEQDYLRIFEEAYGTE